MTDTNITQIHAGGKRTQTWDQLPKETNSAYQAFIVYRDLGPTRTLKEAYRKHRGMPESGARPFRGTGNAGYSGQWGTWCRDYRWSSRVESWDREVVRVAEEAATDEVAAMAIRHARLARAVQGKIVERLRTLNTDELTPAQLIRWLDVSVRIERLASGAVTSRVAREISGPGGGPIEIGNDSNASAAIMAAERAYFEQSYGEPSDLGGEQRLRGDTEREGTV